MGVTKLITSSQVAMAIECFKSFDVKNLGLVKLALETLNSDSISEPDLSVSSVQSLLGKLDTCRVFDSVLNFNIFKRTIKVKLGECDIDGWKFIIYKFSADDKSLRCAAVPFCEEEDMLKFEGDFESLSITCKDNLKDFDQFIRMPMIKVLERVDIGNGISVAVYTQLSKNRATRLIISLPNEFDGKTISREEISSAKYITNESLNQTSLFNEEIGA